MTVNIVENSAKKFADRASLGKGGTSIYTPFAARLWDTEHSHSNG